MEAARALKIWKRSVETRKMRYVEVISDGDSKMITMLNAERPYGDGVVVEKHECVGHIQKWVGYRSKVAKRDFLRDRVAYKKKVKELDEREKEVRKKYGLTRGKVKRGRGDEEAMGVKAVLAVVVRGKKSN